MRHTVSMSTIYWQEDIKRDFHTYVAPRFLIKIQPNLLQRSNPQICYVSKSTFQIWSKSCQSIPRYKRAKICLISSLFSSSSFCTLLIFGHKILTYALKLGGANYSTSLYQFWLESNENLQIYVIFCIKNVKHAYRVNHWLKLDM